MSKKEQNIINITKQAILHANNDLNKQLKFLSMEAGKVYSNSVVLYWRILRKKNIFLSKTSMQKLIRNDNLHSQTVQGIIDCFYDNVKSFIEARKVNSNARMPRRRRRHFVIVYKESAVHQEDGYLELSNGLKTVEADLPKNKRGKPMPKLNRKGEPKPIFKQIRNPSLIIPWKFKDANGEISEAPKHIKISFKDGKYRLNGVYEVMPEICNNSGFAGIDLGDIHIAVAHIIQDQPIAEEKEDQTMQVGVTVIANGKQLRSIKNYQNKKLGEFQRVLAPLKKGSRKWKSINKAKTRFLNKTNNQIKDGLHKLTTEFVVALENNGAKTVGIGDMRTLRNNVDKGKHLNQKIHQMPSGKVRSLIENKAQRRGMQTELVNEAWSSQTCPRCQKKHKPENRNYICNSCGFVFHRDGVGAINICSKTWSGHKLLERAGDDTKPISMYQRFVPVIASGGAVLGEMAPPVGIVYKKFYGDRRHNTTETLLSLV